MSDGVKAKGKGEWEEREDVLLMTLPGSLSPNNPYLRHVIASRRVPRRFNASRRSCRQHQETDNKTPITSGFIVYTNLEERLY